jgi:UDP-glucose:(heptosyl)LPS alpha-1,3-glucosyltransferase
MRVALVYEHFTLRDSLGRDRVLLARALVERGAEVHCYCNSETRVHVDGVEFHDVRPLLRSGSRLGNAVEYGSFAARATRSVRRDRARYDLVDVAGTTAWEHDVVRVHAAQKAEQGRWPERGGRAFRGAHARAVLSPLTRPKLAVARVVERLQFRPGRFKLALAVTDEVADDLRRFLHVAPERIDVVPPPVEIDRFAQSDGSLRRRAGVDVETPLALFLGHDFERKGLTTAIQALADVDGLELAVVGDGDRSRYEREAARLGLGRRIHFLGGTDAPERLLGDADLLVLPTWEDPWGMAVIEAMAAGVPVVVSETAGASRIVEETDAGIVVPAGSPAALGQALAGLTSDRERARRLGERGRAAAERFGLESFGDAVYAAYERVLAAG